MADVGIVRNRAKIEATISNARAAADLDVDLSDLLWSYAPPPRPRPRTLSDVPSPSPESQAMAKELKKRGFRFVGPTTAYALMQATGMVDDHIESCWVPPAAAAIGIDHSRSTGSFTLAPSDEEQWNLKTGSSVPETQQPCGPAPIRVRQVGPARLWREYSMAAMKPRTGDGPLEATKEGRGIVMRVPLEGGGRLVVELTPEEAAALGDELKGVTS